MSKFYVLYGDKLYEAVDALPLAHPNPVGYIRLFCEGKPKARPNAPDFFNPKE